MKPESSGNPTRRNGKGPASFLSTSGPGERLAVSRELGDVYFACDAYAQAESQYRQCLAAGSAVLAAADRAMLRLKIGRCLQRQGRTREVITELDLAVESLDGDASASAALRGRIAATYALVHRQLGEYEAASRRSHEAIEFLTAPEDEEERAEVELCLGTVCLRQGNLYEAERWYKKALVGMSRASSGEGMVKALNNLGLVHRNLGNWDRAVECFQRGIDAAEKLGNYSTIAGCSANLGIVHFHRGDWSRAAACLKRSLAIYRDIGQPAGVVTASLGLGRIHTTLHEWEPAQRSLTEALAAARERNFTREMLVALEFLGDYHMERGELELAESRYREGLAVAHQVAPRSDHVAEISRRMGELELARGNTTGALGFLEEALRVAGEINDKREEAIIHRVLGEVHAARGDRERAKARLGDAVSRMRRLGERFELAKALLATGVVLAERRDGPSDDRDDLEQRSARSFLRESREIFQTLGVRYLAARANVELSRWENRWGSPEGETSTRAAAHQALRPADSGRATLRESVMELERSRILEALQEFNGNQTRVASALGLTRKGLAGKMRRYGLKSANCET